MSVQWKHLTTSNEPPAARAYHSMNCVGSRYLLFGGFDGKSTYGDLWWLVPEGITSFPFMEISRNLTSIAFDSVILIFLITDDPIAKRPGVSSSDVVPEKDTTMEEKV